MKNSFQSDFRLKMFYPFFVIAFTFAIGYLAVSLSRRQLRTMHRDPGTHRKIKIYTRTGDNGTSGLYNGQRVSKTSDYFEALGDLDELNGYLGVCRELTRGDMAKWLEKIQSCLMDVGSHIATPKLSSSPQQLEKVQFDTDGKQTKYLESLIDNMDRDLPPLRNFILPGGGLCSCYLHCSRAIARRAERRVVTLAEREDVDKSVVVFLNRLSDFLFVAARYSTYQENRSEIIYCKTAIQAGTDT